VVVEVVVVRVLVVVAAATAVMVVVAASSHPFNDTAPLTSMWSLHHRGEVLLGDVTKDGMTSPSGLIGGVVT